MLLLAWQQKCWAGELFNHHSRQCSQTTHKWCPTGKLPESKEKGGSRKTERWAHNDRARLSNAWSKELKSLLSPVNILQLNWKTKCLRCYEDNGAVEWKGLLSLSVWSLVQQYVGKSPASVGVCGDHVELSRKKNPLNELRVGSAQSNLCSL